jgi:hypothetical protein
MTFMSRSTKNPAHGELGVADQEGHAGSDGDGWGNAVAVNLHS